MSCYICNDPRAIELHHILPQAYGGQKGPTVPLCSNCHSIAHKAALAILAKKQKGQQFFPENQVEKARPIVMSIVIATQQARDNPDMSHPTTLMLKIPKGMRQLLHVLKTDQNYTNLETFCIDILKTYIRSKM